MNYKYAKQGVPLEYKIQTLLRKIERCKGKTQDELQEAKKSSAVDKEELVFILENRLAAVQAISEITIKNNSDYVFVDFIFNNGNLRTEEEIEQAEKKLEQERIREIKNSEEYKKGYDPIGFFVLIFFVQFLIGALLGIGCLPVIGEPFPDCIERYFGNMFYMLVAGVYCLGIPLFIFPACLTVFYCAIHNEKFGVKDEETGKKIGAIIASVAAGSLYAKKTYKRKY